MNLELLTCYQITSILSGDYQKVVKKDKKSNMKFIWGVHVDLKNFVLKTVEYI